MDQGLHLHQGDAEQVELAKQLDEAEDKLNDRQFSALEHMRDRWATGFEISQADLDDVDDFKKVSRNNRIRTLHQLASKGLATSREQVVEKGRLILFKPVQPGLSHPDSPSGVSVRAETTQTSETSISTTDLSHSYQLFHAGGTPQTPSEAETTPETHSTDELQVLARHPVEPSIPSFSSKADLPDVLPVFWEIVEKYPDALPSQIANKYFTDTSRNIDGRQVKALIDQGRQPIVLTLANGETLTIHDDEEI